MSPMPPLGSGPYRIKSFEAGRSIVYERVADWWAKDLPVARGAFSDKAAQKFILNLFIAFLPLAEEHYDFALAAGAAGRPAGCARARGRPRG